MYYFGNMGSQVSKGGMSTKLDLNTLLIAELLSGKNVQAWVSMDFTQDKFLAPIAIEKIKILGAPWELPAKQHCQFGQFGPNLR